MSKETTDTLGHQKLVNYALRAHMTREEFIAELLDGLNPPPAYFPKNVMMNIKGYESLDHVLERGLKALNPDEFEAAANETGALLLDTRAPEKFAVGFIPNAVNIGIDGGFAPWVGALIPDIQQPILIIADAGREEEVITRMARVGYDHAIGFLQGGFDAWKQAGKETDTINRIQASQMADAFIKDSLVIDVRNPGEYSAGHVEGAILIPLGEINQHLSEIPKDQPFTIHCAGGYRSMIAASILKSRGWDNFSEVEGGYKSISATTIPQNTQVSSGTQA